ncbi:MAG: lipoyl(octanoyl) transferase LipB [Candidatus Sericytochromatia bacterium]|nr:lipoyl(octanoyl) transferase LipB [Candidatus Sericytochromatia bacterium]
MLGKTLEVRRLGLVPYPVALDLMDAAVAARLAGGPDLLMVVRHPPVITVGRKRGAVEHIKEATGLPVVEVPRGGDVTLHGEGQLVAYPVVALEGPERDLHRFLRLLEEACLEALRHFGIRADRSDGRTGVWVGPRKIASVGIAVRSWVTYHGLALNVRPEPLFAAIVPCGLEGVQMTSMEEEAGGPLPLAEVEEVFVTSFGRICGYAAIVPAAEKP